MLPLTIKPKEINKNDLNGFKYNKLEISTAVHAPVIGKGILTNSAKPV